MQMDVCAHNASSVTVNVCHLVLCLKPHRLRCVEGSPILLLLSWSCPPRGRGTTKGANLVILFPLFSPSSLSGTSAYDKRLTVMWAGICTWDLDAGLVCFELRSGAPAKLSHSSLPQKGRSFDPPTPRHARMTVGIVTNLRQEGGHWRKGSGYSVETHAGRSEYLITALR